MIESEEGVSPTAADAQERSPLRGNLGVAKISMMVIAAAAPLTVMGGPALLGIGIGNGVGMPATFVVITVVLLLFAIGFVTMTPFVRSAGAFYSYIQLGLGRGPGVGAGLVALLSYVVIEAGLFGLLGSGANSLLTSYGAPEIAWWVYLLIALPVVLFLGYRNIELAGRVLAVFLIAEVAVVLLLDAAIVFSGGGSEGLSTESLNPAAFFTGSPGLGVMFAILSFLGFEAAAVFRDEARDPERTIPRATFTALVAIGVFYAFSTWAMISSIGDSTVGEYAAENSSTMLGDVAGRYLGVAGAHVVEILFVTSVFACVLSFHNISSRYLYSLSARGLFRPSLGVAHPKYGSPARASTVIGAVNGILLLAAIVTSIDPVNQFYTWLGGVTSLGFLVLMTLTCAAVIVYFRRSGRSGSVWKTLIAPGVGFIGLLVCLVLLIVNLPDLVGGSVAIAIAVVVVVAGVFVAGVLIARRRPRIGMD